MRSFSRATVLAVAAAIPMQLHAQSGPGPFSAERLVAPPTDGWPTNGGNLYNQRYSPLKAIDRTNVAQLKGVWRTRLRGSGTPPQYSGFAAPLVHDGVAYVSTGANDVFALSIDTGEILKKLIDRFGGKGGGKGTMAQGGGLTGSTADILAFARGTLEP